MARGGGETRKGGWSSVTGGSAGWQGTEEFGWRTSRAFVGLGGFACAWSAGMKRQRLCRCFRGRVVMVARGWLENLKELPPMWSSKLRCDRSWWCLGSWQTDGAMRTSSSRLTWTYQHRLYGSIILLSLANLHPTLASPTRISPHQSYVPRPCPSNPPKITHNGSPPSPIPTSASTPSPAPPAGGSAD
ncbi:hypothetical protein T440DRAFT_253030 [Plenodomus tracheiphilus IPT5]|uniref:Uncharacterized protein n=1 Tax=Plenodomus tracheiphilus IPT5 TaxID=1408161 RepID=A0A6A7ASC2_9PLEO|nr:hypothetical protein T440DRAFT_253030 [Plenodomus tracheiphilus IPT5]